jgi:hypothetical protein
MRSIVLRIVAPVALAGLTLVACGGKDLAEGIGASSGGSSSGGSGGGSSGGSVGASSGGSTSSGSSSGSSSGGAGSSGSSFGSSSSASSSGSSGGCVDIDVTTYNQSCVSGSDCISVTGGHLCAGSCLTGGATVNRAEQARYQSAIASVKLGLCTQPILPPPQCIQNKCTLCWGQANDPVGCARDGGSCVDVVPASYDQSCQADTDCIEITAGHLCPGACSCGGATIRASERPRYDATTSGIFGLACPCAAGPRPKCVQDKCINCGYGPNQPPGCSDGG